MKKTTWGDPILYVQVFTPQECVAACNIIIVTGSGWNPRPQSYYIDYNPKNNRYNDGEAFDATGHVNGNHDGPYSNVTVYKERNAVTIPFIGITLYYTYSNPAFSNINVRIKNGYAYNVS